MQRSISSYALLLSSVSAILGSGWLFAAYYTAELAGPSAILAWLLGGAGVIIIAFTFAELCALLPITGSSTRIPQYTHGTIVSFTFSWIIWLSYTALVPTEVQAVLQYLSYYFPYLVHANGGLTSSGYSIATILMFLISVLNVFSLRWVLRCNTALTVIKILIPTIISLILIGLFLSTHHVAHPHQLAHPHHSTFMPFGVHGILAAITTGGIIFAFNGFKQACEMAGEAKNPHRTVPIAVIGSVLVCLTIYLLLQLAFLSSLTTHNLLHGWHHIDLQGGNSPFASVIQQTHLQYLLPLVYLAAIIGPLAAGLMYIGSSARSLYGMSMNQQIPGLFGQLSAQGNPLYAIIISFVLGLFMFAPLPGWNSMISYLTSLMAMTYAIAPICLLSLRHQIPEHKRPFKLPFATLWSTFAFYLCTLLTYWSGWNIVSKLIIALTIGLIVLIMHHVFLNAKKKINFHWKASLWIWPYFLGMALISYLGNFGGGKSIIPFGLDFAYLGLLSVITMFLAIKFKLPAVETKKYIAQLNLHTCATLATPTTQPPIDIIDAQEETGRI